MSDINKNERDRIKNYIDCLLSKGYSKNKIKKELLSKGFDRFLVRQLIYPNLKLLVYSGVVLICMILIIGWFYFFMMLDGNNISFSPIINKDTLKSVGDVVVDDVTIEKENDVQTVNIFLKNTGDSVFEGEMQIKVYSGEAYSSWSELRTINPGDTLVSSAAGFRTPEKLIRVEINGEEVFSKTFVFA